MSAPRVTRFVFLCVGLAAAGCYDVVSDGPLGDGGFPDQAIPDLRAEDALAPPDLTPMCTPSTVVQACVEADEPVCANGACAACTSAEDPQCDARVTGDVCVTSGHNAGQCGQCNPSPGPATQNAHCTPSPSPICDPSGVCRGCQNNTECNSGVCCTRGTLVDGSACTIGACADPSTLLYVNNGSPRCSDGGNGSLATPLCTLTAGVAASNAQGKPVVLFAGHGYGEGLRLTAPYNATVIGVGNPIVSPSASPALAITGTTGGTIAVNVDGIVVDATRAGAMVDAVDCFGNNASYGSTSLTIVRSTIKNANGLGVSVNGKSTVTLDADIFLTNAGGGLSIASSDYSLTNLLMVLNGTGGTNGTTIGGIYLGGTGEATKMNIANLTLAFNQIATTDTISAGITCAGATPTQLINVVAWKNAGGEEGDINMCGAKHVAFIGAGTQNGNQELSGCTPFELFADSNPLDVTQWIYVPKPGGTSCTLVDDGQAAGAPPFDLVGTPRPQGNGVDIGAYESK